MLALDALDPLDGAPLEVEPAPAPSAAGSTTTSPPHEEHASAIATTNLGPPPRMHRSVAQHRRPGTPAIRGYFTQRQRACGVAATPAGAQSQVAIPCSGVHWTLQPLPSAPTSPQPSRRHELG